jgi:hypothetical protein
MQVAAEVPTTDANAAPDTRSTPDRNAWHEALEVMRLAPGDAIACLPSHDNPRASALSSTMRQERRELTGPAHRAEAAHGLVR